MARQLSDITVSAGENGQVQIEIATQFPTANFTLQLNVPAIRVQVNGADLTPVQTRQAFQEGKFLREGQSTALAFALPIGGTSLAITLA